MSKLVASAVLVSTLLLAAAPARSQPESRNTPVPGPYRGSLGAALS